MLEKERPTPEQIACAKEIVQSMVNFYDKNENTNGDIIQDNTELDPIAEKARKELLG